MIIVNKWVNRLGNNIVQLSNSIGLAILYRHNITFNVQHKLFDVSIIEKYFSKYDNSEILEEKQNFFRNFSKRPYKLERGLFEQHQEETNKLLKKAFLIKDITKIPENNLVIHIRSGDTFKSTAVACRTVSKYIPPPLSYYTKHINKRKYKKIIIVCEDRINPVVNKLLELYKNSVHEINSLEKDISIILGATNILYSVGTFVPALLLMSDNIKYCHGVEFRNPELIDYYKKMKPWRNSKKQRKLILTYVYD